MENDIQTSPLRCPLCDVQGPQFFGKKNDCSLYSCQNCNLLFVHPVPHATDAVYGEDYFEGASEGFGYTNYDADKEAMTPVFEEYVRRILAFKPSGPKLLDVGAATGFFVHIARRHGFNASGIEISAYAAARGREKGFDIRQGVLSDISSNECFDVITMLDVIEHVTDPRGELSHAFELLNTEGLLIINTPDRGSVWARLMGKRWHLIVPPEHLFYFNRRNLSKLLAACGFEVLEVTTIGKSFTISYILKTLYEWQKLRIWKWLEKGIGQRVGNISIPINLRDNLFLIARKK
jgi:2-polyprenyl-3-methyl-5-hydroxy-6-metoxy-1,4-benzoquinol methylase